MATNSTTSCAACGRPLPGKQGRGRRQQYCNATCRSAGRRQRIRAASADPTNVNTELTENDRHGSLDVMPGTDSRAEAAMPASDREQPDQPAASPLAAIAQARQQVAAAETALQAAVDQARAAGHSWREIGDVLDTTRQAAFQRFGRPVDPRTGAPMSRPVLPGAAERATTIFTHITACRWEEARRELSERMRRDLDADRLADGWVRTVGMIGNFERMGEALAYPVADSTVTDIPLYFEAGERTGRVTFDRDGEIVGLFIRPASA
jgi:hypothetical protein